MKTEFIEVIAMKPEPTFPCLMRSKSGEKLVVVLFDQEKCGMVVHCPVNGYWKVGDYHSNWDMKQFKPAAPGSTITIKV